MVKLLPYAIVHMEKSAQPRLQYVNDNVGAYIDNGISTSDLFVHSTYERAVKHAREAPVSQHNCKKVESLIFKQTEEERKLLTGALYMWVAVRMSSTTEWIMGDDHLNILLVTDLTSPYYNHTPIPPVMSAQGQIIAYSKFGGHWKKYSQTTC